MESFGGMPSSEQYLKTDAVLPADASTGFLSAVALPEADI